MTDVRLVELIVLLVRAQKAGDRERAAAIRRQLEAAHVLVRTPRPQELDAAFDLWRQAG